MVGRKAIIGEQHAVNELFWLDSRWCQILSPLILITSSCRSELYIELDVNYIDLNYSIILAPMEVHRPWLLRHIIINYNHRMLLLAEVGLEHSRSVNTCMLVIHLPCSF